MKHSNERKPRHTQVDARLHQPMSTDQRPTKTRQDMTSLVARQQRAVGAVV